MKKIYGLISTICILSTATLIAQAAESIEHFVTNDGRHFCSVFMKQDFQPCETFGIVYEGESVVSGEKPFFAAGFPKIEKITIGNEEFCVEGSAVETGREVDMQKCMDLSGTTSTESETSVTDMQAGDDVIPLEGEALTGSQNTSITESGDTQSGDMIPVVVPQAEDATGAMVSPPLTNIKQSGPECIVNGKKVDCAELAASAKSVMKTGFGILAIFLVISLLFGIFWIWMLVHAISQPIPNKVLWVLVIFFLSPLGAIVYYFAIKKKFVPQANFQLPTAQGNPPNLPPNPANIPHPSMPQPMQSAPVAGVPTPVTMPQNPVVAPGMAAPVPQAALPVAPVPVVSTPVPAPTYQAPEVVPPIAVPPVVVSGAPIAVAPTPVMQNPVPVVPPTQVVTPVVPTPLPEAIPPVPPQPSMGGVPIPPQNQGPTVL